MADGRRTNMPLATTPVGKSARSAMESVDRYTQE
jgi:hypothetical protein